MKTFQFFKISNQIFYQPYYFINQKPSQMHKEFTLDLSDNEAQYLNVILPRNHSFQIFQKLERKRKAEKKLDDMYVAEFSLRPIKKIKKQNQLIPQKNQKHSPQFNKPQPYEPDPKKNNDKQTYPNIKQDQEKAKKMQAHQNNVQQKQIQSQKKDQTTQRQSSRRQRVSKPTQAYLQFQQETFKRKIVQRIQQNTSLKGPQNSHQPCEQKLKGQLNHAIQEANQNIIDQEEKVQIQKQSPQQQKRQFVQKKDLLQKIQSLEQKFGQKDLLQEKQNSQIMQDQNHEKRVDTQKEGSFQNGETERNRNSFFGNDILVVQNRQKSQNNIPKVVIEPQQLKEIQGKGGSIGNNRHVRVFYNSQQQPILLKRCWRILQRLKTHKASWPFRLPVDPVRQGVPDYLDIIKTPMDLKTIEKNIRTQKYITENDFYSDVNLMLQNSYQYNSKTTKYYKLTNQLEKYFNELKAKSSLSQYSARSSIRDIKKYSDYSGDQGIQQEGQKMDSKVYKGDQLHEQRSSKEENRKRNSSHFENPQSNLTNNHRKITKVFITSEGPIRNDKNGEENSQIHYQNPIIQNQVNPTPYKIQKNIETIKRYAQVRQINENIQTKSPIKQSRLLKVNSIKRQVKLEEGNGTKKEAQRIRSGRLGYPQPKITLIQRESLLYDILHIESIQIRNKIEQFLERNEGTFSKFKHYKDQLGAFEGKQDLDENKDVRQQEQSSKSYDFELGDLDPQSYKILRAQIDRLMRLDGQCREVQMSGLQDKGKQANQVRQ